MSPHSRVRLLLEPETGSQSGDQHDLADVSPFADQSMCISGLLKREGIGHDRFDRAVGEQSVQWLYPWSECSTIRPEGV